jgi:hypothetical protein
MELNFFDCEGKGTKDSGEEASGGKGGGAHVNVLYVLSVLLKAESDNYSYKTK